jgi:hypothetical protein
MEEYVSMSTSSFATDTFEPYLSPEVAAKYLGISRRELLAHTRSGRFVGHAVDPNARRKDWRFKISELDAAMSSPTAVTQNSYNAKRQPGTQKAS